jgi:hypothetical protein
MEAPITVVPCVLAAVGCNDEGAMPERGNSNIGSWASNTHLCLSDVTEWRQRFL